MRTPGFIGILKIEDFRKLFLAQVISNFGDAITKIALVVFIYEKTGSAVSLSIVLLMQTFPRMVIGPMAGVLVDKVDRKAVLIASDVTRAILMSLLFGTTNVLQVYLIAALHGTFSTVFTPARLAVLPEITGRTLYVKGISLTQMASQIIAIFGLSLGGTIVGLIGARTTFLVDAITFSASAVLIFRTRIPKIAPKFPAASGRILSDFKEGLAFLSNQPVLRFLLWVYVLMASFGGMVGAVTLVYVKRSLHRGAYEYGVLMASLSIGILVGSLFIGKYEHRTRRGAFLIGGALLRGLVYLPAYFTPPLGIMMTLWFTGGLVQSVVSIFGNAFFAEITPSEMRGRTYSVMNGVLSGVQLLPMYAAGLLAEAMKASNVITLSGSVMLIGMLGLMTCSRGYQALRRYTVDRI